MTDEVVEVKKRKSPKHGGVDKDLLHQTFVEYRAAQEYARLNDLPEPECPKFIHECIIKIAKHLGTRFNFRSYTYNDEMILEGISHSFMYGINGYDVNNKLKNPFGYFSLICWRGFQSVIIREKKHEAIAEYCKYNVFPYIEGEDNQGLVNLEALRSYNDQLQD